MKLEDIKKDLEKRLSKRRFIHSLLNKDGMTYSTYVKKNVK